MSAVEEASRLLDELGITEPDELDLDAIAFHCGALVDYEPLTGCEARVIGHRDKAIICVNNRTIVERQRFSLGHELGHWRLHRGARGFLCNKDALQEHKDSGRGAEAAANSFAAELLMPRAMFLESLRGKRVDFDSVVAVSSVFTTSKTATAIRWARLSNEPMIVVGTHANGKLWFHIPSTAVPIGVRPRSELHHESRAFATLFGSSTGVASRTPVPGDRWFSTRGASQTKVWESSMRINDGRMLTLLSWGSPRDVERLASAQGGYG